jgi:putative ABC transport system substrate-binding protein
MKRRALLGVLGAAPWFASVSCGAAQNRVPKIGFLTPNAEGVPFEQGFHQGLRELGYSEGTSIIIEWRRAKDREDLAVPLALELVQRQVALIVTVGTSAAHAAMKATATIPIVSLSGAPLSTGLTASMARPDRNATGISFLTSELFPKRLEYLHWLAPRAGRIAYLVDSSNALAASQIEAVQNGAHLLGLQLIRLDARDPDELGRVNTSKGFHDQREVNEGDKHHIEFLESREDAPESLQSAEQTLDLIAPLVHLAIVFPGIDSIALRRNHGNEV